MIPPEMNGYSYLKLPLIGVNANITVHSGHFGTATEQVI
jgi:hypothetical protein